MAEITKGMKAPDFTLPATGGTNIQLSQFYGKKVVIFFYSKDNTPGCTNEVREFNELYNEFANKGIIILGISRDSIQTHEKFSAKLELSYLLLSDSQEEVCKLYNVLREKNMYGKKVIGVERSTFIINEKGEIDFLFRKVRATGHAAQVLEMIKDI